MNIRVNGDNLKIDDKLNITIFLEKYLNKKEFGGIAVAKNGTIVPKSTWENTLVEENDEIEIVHAVQGG